MLQDNQQRDCDMATAACHATLASTLRDTLQEMLHRVSLPHVTRDGISSKSLIELVKFLDWNKSNTVAIPVDSHIVTDPLLFQEQNNNSSTSLVNTNCYRKSKHQLIGRSSCGVVPLLDRCSPSFSGTFTRPLWRAVLVAGEDSQSLGVALGAQTT